MTGIDAIEGITPDEKEKLLGQRIQTIEDLWERIGADFERGIHQLAEDAKIEPGRLIDLLADQGVREARQPEDGWLSRHASLIVGLALLGVLGLCAWSAFVFALPPLGLRTTVVITARDLEPGRVLRSGDLYNAQLPPGTSYFTTTDELEGLILAQGLSRGKQLRFDNVLRPQVVAARDIPSNTIITSDHISVTWSP